MALQPRQHRRAAGRAPAPPHPAQTEYPSSACAQCISHHGSMRRQCHAPVGHQLRVSVVAAERRLEAQVAEDARENGASVSVHMAPGGGPYVIYCPSQARVGGVDGPADLSLAAFHSASHGVESTARTEGVILILRPKSQSLV